MANPPALSKLTSMQKLFLNALAGEAKGDPNVAKKIAGYSDNTQIVDIMSPLKDHLAGLARDALTNAGLKAAFGLIDALDNPASMGVKNKISAASQILDRIGVAKPDTDVNVAPKAAVFILPPKNIASIVIEDGHVTVDMSDTEDKIIEYNPPKESDPIENEPV